MFSRTILSPTPLVIALLLLAGRSALADHTIFDGTFAPSDWTLTDASPSGSSVAAGQSLTGGDPGAYRSMVFNYQDPSIGTPYASYSLDVGATYSPATQGAITSLTFDASVSQLGAFYVAPVLEQGGVIYAGFGGSSNSNQLGWVDYASTIGPGDGPYTQGDFASVAGDGTHPDFSAAGAPIAFGYEATLFFEGPPPSQGSLPFGLDNFTVALQTRAVPEPASLTVLGLGAAGLVSYARRRRNARIA